MDDSKDTPGCGCSRAWRLFSVTQRTPLACGDPPPHLRTLNPGDGAAYIQERLCSSSFYHTELQTKPSDHLFLSVGAKLVQHRGPGQLPSSKQNRTMFSVTKPQFKKHPGPELPDSVVKY
ncbi:hypothetical protein STEG23_018859 [Scotinomys teguina]